MTLTKTTFGFVMAGLVLLPAIAHAQSNDIMNRLSRMENEIQTLNRALYRGEKVPVPLTPQPDPASTQLLGQVQQLETDLRNLTGRVEQQTYEINQLRQQVEAMSYQLQQAQTRVQTPVVPQSAEYMRPDENTPAVNAGSGQLLPDEMAAQELPQPTAGMRTATPALPDGSDPVALYEASYNKIRTGGYAQAEQGFKQFIERYPDHQLTGNAYYWLGETYYVRGDYAQATRTFAQSYQKFPKGAKGPDNLLKLSLSLAAEGKPKDSCVALMQLAKEYPAAAPEIVTTADAQRAKLNC